MNFGVARGAVPIEGIANVMKRWRQYALNLARCRIDRQVGVALHALRCNVLPD